MRSELRIYHEDHRERKREDCFGGMLIGKGFWDFNVYYTEGQMFLDHQNPYTVAGAFPWTYVMNLFLVMPFLPRSVACCFGFVIMVCVFAALTYIMFKSDVWVKLSKDNALAKEVSFTLFFLYFQ